MLYELNGSGGDEGLVTRALRLWWLLMSHYHTYKWLYAQTFSSNPPPHLLPRNERRRGETAVVTGGSRGIGVAVARRLLQMDMHVVIGCRNTTGAYEQIKKIRRKGVTTGTVEILPLDLGSFNSIREFAFKILRKEIILTVLINNAGVKEAVHAVTVEGFEQHLQVNYLGPVLLTQMLLPKLHSDGATKSSRVVNLTSPLHNAAHPNLDHMNHFYSNEKSFMDSKLMLTTYSHFLDTQLCKLGANIRSFAVHPGFVNTEISSQLSSILHSLVYERQEEAAETVAYVALSPALEGKGGLLLHHREPLPLKPHPLCTNPQFQTTLWRKACKYLNLPEDSLGPLEPEGSSSGTLNNLQFGFGMDFHLKTEHIVDGCNNTWSSWRHSLTSQSIDLIGDESQPYYEIIIRGLFNRICSLGGGSIDGKQRGFIMWPVQILLRIMNFQRLCSYLRSLERMSIFFMRKIHSFKIIHSFIKCD